MRRRLTPEEREERRTKLLTHLRPLIKAIEAVAEVPFEKTFERGYGRVRMVAYHIMIEEMTRANGKRMRHSDVALVFRKAQTTVHKGYIKADLARGSGAPWFQETHAEIMREYHENQS